MSDQDPSYDPKEAEAEIQRLTAALRESEEERALLELAIGDSHFSRVETEEILEHADLVRSIFDTSLIQLSIMKAIRDEEGDVVDFKIVAVNRERERATGKTDLAGKSYLQEFPDKPAKLLKVMVEVLETGKPGQLEYSYVHHGELRWFSSMFVKFDDGLVATRLDITESKKSREEILQLKLRQQKEVLNAIVQTQELERERIGESLHNGLAQLIYAMQTRLQLLHPRPEEQQMVSDLIAIAKDAITEAKNLSFELVPALLKDFGIEKALRSLFQRVVPGAIKLAMHFEGLNNRLPESIEYPAYRIVQELVNNIIKHSKATAARIDVKLASTCFCITVSDNGVGFEYGSPDHPKGLGLISIRNRVALLDGSFDVKARSGGGACIEIKLPV